MKSKFRRLALVLLGCWGLVAWLVGSVVAQGAKMWLDPPMLDLAPGGEGTLDIRVENVAQLAGAEVHLIFDPALLEVVDADSSMGGTQIAHGDFLSPDFVAQNTVDPVAGTVDYAIACMPLDKSVSGSGVLSRVTFRAMAEGETLVDISSFLLANVQEQPIAVETGSSVVVVSRPGPSLTVWVLIGLVAVAVAAGFVAVVWNAIKTSELAHY